VCGGGRSGETERGERREERGERREERGERREERGERREERGERREEIRTLERKKVVCRYVESGGKAI
jgi:hypothetical protein